MGPFLTTVSTLSTWKQHCNAGKVLSRLWDLGFLRPEPSTYVAYVFPDVDRGGHTLQDYCLQIILFQSFLCVCSSISEPLTSYITYYVFRRYLWTAVNYSTSLHIHANFWVTTLVIIRGLSVVSCMVEFPPEHSQPKSTTNTTLNQMSGFSKIIFIRS